MTWLLLNGTPNSVWHADHVCLYSSETKQISKAEENEIWSIVLQLSVLVEGDSEDAVGVWPYGSLAIQVESSEGLVLPGKGWVMTTLIPLVPCSEPTF